MVIASLAWSLNAWMALALPEGGRDAHKRRAEKYKMLRMLPHSLVQGLGRLNRRSARLIYCREHQVVDIVLRATRPADFHRSPRREPRGELTMCRKAASRHSKTLGMDTVLPNHLALGATLTPLSARASGFRGTVVAISQPKTTVNNIVLGVVFNHRQSALIIEAVKTPGRRYTIKEHQNMRGVVYQTARTDLLDLENRGVLELKKKGKKLVFRVPSDIGERLERLDDG